MNNLQHYFPKSEAEWLGLREGRITSSVVAAAIGLDPFSTPLDAWLKITGRDAFDGNKATIRGTRLESPVLDYPLRGGHFVRKPAPFVRAGNGYSADSTDCLYEARDKTLILGEGKTVALGGIEHWGAEYTDDIPGRVVVQCCWHLMHWPQADRVIVPVLMGGYTFEFREYVVQRDDELIGNIAERANKWWRDHVVMDMPPEATLGDDDNLRLLWPKHIAEKYLTPTKELEELTRAYVAARDQESSFEKLKKEAGVKLRQLIGDAEGAIGDGWKVTHKYQGGDKVETDWESLAKFLGATEADEQQFARESKGFRVLRASLPATEAEKAAKKTTKKAKAA